MLSFPCSLSCHGIFATVSTSFPASSGGLPSGSSTDGTEGMSTHSADISLRLFFLHPSASFLFSKMSKSRSNRPKKSFLPSPPFLLVYIYCMTAILSREFLWKKSHFPALEACLPSLAYLASFATVCITCAGYLVDSLYQRFYRVVFRKKAERKVDEITNEFIGSIKKGE